ncbi:hypothetical protein VFPPC_16792 [Pochonia chlamydosporia 170]|uniref:Uncharacterized protein n=1 Tax=Pochonia chlamydosporia 170 TaxID=1380566 RepID=A0A179F4K3_METCM|nr:hypothetical protein VFPPC_16792 [Pochonia chlamydosporia 170]OAQ60300.1 hypothetical protein VFPPC_16792 [Pochonia chlamydosporia 170]
MPPSHSPAGDINHNNKQILAPKLNIFSPTQSNSIQFNPPAIRAKIHLETHAKIPVPGMIRIFATILSTSCPRPRNIPALSILSISVRARFRFKKFIRCAGPSPSARSSLCLPTPLVQ